MGIPMPVESVVHEVDLSDEWAALSQQLETTMREDSAADAAGSAIPFEDTQVEAPVLIPAEQEHADAVSASGLPSFDLELQPMAPANAAENGSAVANSLIADLAEDMDSVVSALGSSAETLPAERPKAAAPPREVSRPPARPSSGNGAPPQASAEPLSGPLGDLFEEFRSELGESGKEDEDLETHYNLGIAYREMGLLEEAISEFQKVASSVDKGPAFRYAMQCSTLLGLAFMEKGQPAIAAIWYERALKTPGLDQESILALRYDLGVAQELAGDTQAAFSSFSQVYAMNIDYRDVSERIALLGKAR
jgi:tetratricopeptide (TPR) repeat protein